MKTIPYKEKEGFQEAMVNQIPNLLDDALEWIGNKLDPEDVFPDKVLETWAEDNGYIKKEE